MNFLFERQLQEYFPWIADTLPKVAFKWILTWTDSNGDPACVTLGWPCNQSTGGIKGNQATFDNSQRNNLRSYVWVFGGSVGEDVRSDVSSFGARRVSIYRHGVG